MSDGKSITPAELAARTGTAERYIREWLNANAAGNYVTYHAATTGRCKNSVRGLGQTQ